MTDEEKAFQHWARLAVEAEAAWEAAKTAKAVADAAQTRALLASGKAAGALWDAYRGPMGTAALAALREAALKAAREEKSAKRGRVNRETEA